MLLSKTLIQTNPAILAPFRDRFNSVPALRIAVITPRPVSFAIRRTRYYVIFIFTTIKKPRFHGRRRDFPTYISAISRDPFRDADHNHLFSQVVVLPAFRDVSHNILTIPEQLTSTARVSRDLCRFCPQPQHKLSGTLTFYKRLWSSVLHNFTKNLVMCCVAVTISRTTLKLEAALNVRRGEIARIASRRVPRFFLRGLSSLWIGALWGRWGETVA